VLADPAAVRNPFFLLAPGWLSLPLVLLATAATVIASQAVISGAFTITSQAIKLGYVPRMKIEFTSSTMASQIYVPFVNWMLLITIVLLVVGFQASERLAGAYGLAVAATLLIDTLGIIYVARRRWQWSTAAVVAVFAPILTLDVAFLASNAVGKLAHGGWFPLLFGAVMFFLFLTWKQGRHALETELLSKGFALDPFIKSLTTYPPQRIEGTAVFMTPKPDLLPHALLHNLKHNRVLHERTIFLSAVTETVPHVPPAESVTVRDLGDGCYAVSARLGFQDPHDIAHIAGLLSRGHEFEFNVQETSFFLSRQTIVPEQCKAIRPWRARVFSWMMRNAEPASDFFRIPPNRVIEIGTQVSI
jgi:KUP system potassium uptake protein